MLYDPVPRERRGGTPAQPDPGRRADALSRLAADVPEVVTDIDEATGNPVLIMTRSPDARLTTPGRGPADSPEAAASQFIADRGDLYDLDAEDPDTIKVVGVSTRGLPTVRVIQRIDDDPEVEVFGSDLTVSVTPTNEVFAVSGQVFRGAAASRARARDPGGMSSEEAIAKAARDLTGMTFEAGDFPPAEAPSNRGPYRLFEFRRKRGDRRPAFERPARVKEVMFPLGDGAFFPAYYLELWLQRYPTFAYVVDKDPEAELLFRKNLTSQVAFTYRVHNSGPEMFQPLDGPAPGTPHPDGTPTGFQADPVAEQLVTIESLLPGDPWLPDDATTTSGNNCIAYADLRAPNRFSTGDLMGQVTSDRTFDYTYNHSKPSTDSTNLQNSIVGMFFHVNWLHDRWYEAGFDEASGNAQADNFGRGGIDGDPILAEGNDYSGHDNANMSTPADGASPRMQMYRFDGPRPLPNRTSNHEALITFHEMGHYITNRLVGNATGLTNRQGKAMGEGWGDFFAICMTSEAADDFAGGCFAVGGWTDLRSNFKENYYFSIRRYPYSADMTKNPLTFKHISTNNVLPVGPERNPTAGGPNSEVHNAGEVWCSALWEVFVNLVAKHGHQNAERRMLEYVIGGLKLTPKQPTFTQARDGIIAAVTGLHADDLGEVWAGFAKRGMGRAAVSPPSTSNGLTEVQEDFTV
jgi:hypothetical protein